MAAGELSFAIKAVNDSRAALSSVEHDIGAVGDAASRAHPHTSAFGSALSNVGQIAAGFVIGQGLLRLPGFLMDAGKAAAEDEAATARLHQVFQNYANMAGASAGTFAALNGLLEERIGIGQRLAFSDDDVRDSFAFLLTATDDSTEATKRQSAAFDLARGANIPLTLATKMLGKITEENVNTFKKLGIELPKTASEADALAAVQARFGGQAEAYAKSTAGQFEQLKIRLSEAKETIGAALLPVMNTLGGVLLDYVAPAIERFVGALGGVANDAVAAAFGLIRDAAVAIGAVAWDPMVAAFSLAWDAIGVAWGLIKDGAAALAGIAWEAMGGAFDRTKEALNGIPWDRIKGLGGDAASAAGDVGLYASAWEKTKNAIQPALDALRPFVDRILGALKEHFQVLGDELGRLGEAFRPLGEVLKEHQGFFEAIGKVIGAVLVVSIAVLLLQIEALIKLFTISLVVGIETARLAVLAIAKAVDILATSFEAGFSAAQTVITDWLPKLVEAAKAIIDGMYEGITGAWALVNTWFGGVPQKVLDAVGDLSRILFDAGKAIIQGLIDGIEEMFGRLKDVLGRVTDLIPKIKGPLDRDRQLLVPAGQAIMDGLVDGLTSRIPAVTAVLTGLTNMMAGGRPIMGWIPDPGDRNHPPGWEWDPINGVYRPPGGGPPSPPEFQPKPEPWTQDPWWGWKEKDAGYWGPGGMPGQKSVTFNINLPNYLGDRSEVVDTLERELRLRFA